MKCLKCGADNRSRATFCNSCGSELEGVPPAKNQHGAVPEGTTTCINGHVFRPKEREKGQPQCPYCPTNRKGVPPTVVVPSPLPEVGRPGDIPPGVAPADPGLPGGGATVVDDDRPLVGWLVVVESKRERLLRDYHVLDGQNLLVGGKDRRPGKVFIDDPKVSSSQPHAVLSHQNGRYTLRDNASTNGTHVNGQMLVETVQLEDGDEISVGTTTLVFKAFARAVDGQ